MFARQAQKDDQQVTIAQCPACAEQGHDQSGRNHLIVYADGRFGCVVNPGDREHRSRINALVGQYSIAPLAKKGAALRKQPVNHARIIRIPIGTTSNLSKNPPSYTSAQLSATCSDIPGKCLEKTADLPRLAEILRAAGKPIAVDVQTSTANRNEGSQVAATLTLAIPGHCWTVDIASTNTLGSIGAVLESSMLICRDAKPCLAALEAIYGVRPTNVFCIQTALKLLQAGTQPSPSSDTGIEAAAKDVTRLHMAKALLEQALAAAGLTQVADLEMQLIPIVMRIEATGVPVDVQRLKEVLAKAERESMEARQQLFRCLGGAKPDLNKPKELIEALNAIGVEVANTSANTLSQIDHAAAKAILAFRRADSLLRQIRALLEHVAADGRIHTHLDPLGCATGRFSSSGPNLQSVGRGELRSCIAAHTGYSLIIADYSQIELRVAAAIAPEPRMLEALRNGQDLHALTAEVLLGRRPSSDDRKLAKAVNFGLLFGQGTRGLVSYARQAYGVRMTIEEAEKFRRRFFDAFPGLAQFHKGAWDAADGNATETRTRLGRRRLLPPASAENRWARFAALVNSPIQGTAADGMKLAIVELAKQLPARAEMTLTVHDELLLLAPEEMAGEILDLTRGVMTSEMQRLLPEVPIMVDARVCRNWGEEKS